MDITIDTSILIAVVSNEPSRQLAIRATAGHSLIAPNSVHWEVGNALSSMIKRQRITVAQARACITSYHQIPIKFVDVDLKETLTLVERLRVYAYDAYLLVCARQTATPILTLDETLQAAAAAIGIEILEV